MTAYIHKVDTVILALADYGPPSDKFIKAPYDRGHSRSAGQGQHTVRSYVCQSVVHHVNVILCYVVFALESITVDRKLSCLRADHMILLDHVLW